MAGGADNTRGAALRGGAAADRTRGAAAAAAAELPLLLLVVDAVEDEVFGGRTTR